MNALPPSFHAKLSADGLNLVGVIPALRAKEFWLGQADYPYPLTGSFLIIGSGGREHWSFIQSQESPSFSSEKRPHVIEETAHQSIRGALSALPWETQLLSVDESYGFDLRGLAVEGGLGTLSPYLMMVLHPRYGPWISLRALLYCAADLPASSPMTDYDPCADCDKPCLTACPAGAYSPDSTWNFQKCADHRLKEKTVDNHCADQCHVRLACPVGREYAYSEAEFRHRHRSSLPMIRAFLEDPSDSE